jgi:hypothetical protein
MSLVLLSLVLVFVAPAAAAGPEAGVFAQRTELMLPRTFVATGTAAGHFRQELLPSDGEVLLAQVAIRQDESSVKKGQERAGEAYKSPGKAFVFSALAPGSGQLYVGSKRGYVYLGIEAVAWTSSYFFHKSGKQKEDEYMDFADAHWFEPAVGESVGVAPDGSTIYYDEEHHKRIVYFYQHDKGHYYEDIGKYIYYQAGWDPGTLNDYLDMRDDSNRLLKNSGYAAMAAVVNHVVSAIDALRLARSHNLSLGHGVNINLKFRGNLHSRGVMVVASRKF